MPRPGKETHASCLPGGSGNCTIYFGRRFGRRSPAYKNTNPLAKCFRFQKFILQRHSHVWITPHTGVLCFHFFFCKREKNCKEAEHERNQINMAHQYHGPLCSYEKGVPFNPDFEALTKEMHGYSYNV